jgi:predicted nucleotidyltransferase
MKIKTPDSIAPVSEVEATQGLLCGFASGNMIQPLPGPGVDWQELYERICRNGLLGLAHHHLAQRQDQDNFPTKFRQQVQLHHRSDALRMALLYRHLGQVLAELAESEVDFIVIKGPAVAYTVYPNPTWRPFGDLDLVVRERDLVVIHQLLLEMGFRQKLDRPPPPARLIPRAVQRHLAYAHPETILVVEVHYDDFLIAGLVSRDLEGFWRRVRRIEVEGVPVNVLSLEDQLIHLCAHAHAHGYGRLIWFSDLAFILRHHGAQLDWERLIETVQLEEAEVGVYYSLYFLERLLGIAAPAAVLAALRPDPFRRWWHERFLPEKKVLALQPLAIDLGLHVLPLFTKLLPELLMMGRRREKLSFLLRLMLPPAAWLRYYYGLDQGQGLAPHYLLHPLKLMYHYLAEIFTPLARIKRWYKQRQARRTFS